MESKAKFLGHPIHQMLIVFPLGLLITSVIFDVLHWITGDGKWSDMAYYLIAAGIVGGLLAAIFGLIDWLALPDNTRAKQVGALHGVGNVLVIGLFALSWLLRREAPADPRRLAYVLSFLGMALGGVTAWMGGELVDRLAVGVHRGAHLDAPNSLSGRPASENAHSTIGD